MKSLSTAAIFLSFIFLMGIELSNSSRFRNSHSAPKETSKQQCHWKAIDSLHGLDDLLRSEFQQYYQDTDHIHHHVYYYKRKERRLRAFDALVHDRNLYRRSVKGHVQNTLFSHKDSLWSQLQERGILISVQELTDAMTEWIAEQYQQAVCKGRCIEKFLQVILRPGQKEARALLAFLKHEPDKDEPISNDTIQKAKRFLTRFSAPFRRMSTVDRKDHHLDNDGYNNRFRIDHRTMIGNWETSAQHRPTIRSLIDLIHSKLRGLDSTGTIRSSSDPSNISDESGPIDRVSHVEPQIDLPRKMATLDQTTKIIPSLDTNKSGNATLEPLTMPSAATHLVPLCPPISNSDSHYSNRLGSLFLRTSLAAGSLACYHDQVYPLQDFCFNSTNVTLLSSPPDVQT